MHTAATTAFTEMKSILHTYAQASLYKLTTIAQKKKKKSFLSTSKRQLKNLEALQSS